MRDKKLALLQAALLLPLSDAEHQLLLNITHHYALGQERDWGMANFHRMDEVATLFNKCREMLFGVS